MKCCFKEQYNELIRVELNLIVLLQVVKIL